MELALQALFSIVYCLQLRPVITRRKHLSGAPLLVSLLAVIIELVEEKIDR
jgi:hypothetical protein